MRLRQCACSPALVPPARLQAARDVAALVASRAAAAASGKGKAPAAPLDKEEAKRLFATLAGKLSAAAAAAEDAPDADAAECAVCLESATAETIRILRACRHAFCRP